MNNNAEGLLVVGRIGSVYGIQGWLKVFSYTDPKTNLLTYSPWQIQIQGQWQIKKILAARPHGKELVVHFDHYDNPEKAKVLTGAEIAIQRTQLPALDKNEYYWADLIGLTVVNQDNAILGVITQLFETGSNDVIVVKGEKEHLLPYLLDSIVQKIDLANKTMHVNWDAEF